MRRIIGIIPTTYEQAQARLGFFADATLARNTKLIHIDGGTIGLLLHGTLIVEYTTRGEYIIRTGGFRTKTTQARINSALHGSGWRIEDEAGEWIVTTGRPSRPAFRFFEGVTLKRPGGCNGSCDLGQVAK